MFGLAGKPPVARTVASVFSLVAASDFLHFGYEASHRGRCIVNHKESQIEHRKSMSRLRLGRATWPTLVANSVSTWCLESPVTSILTDLNLCIDKIPLIGAVGFCESVVQACVLDDYSCQIFEAPWTTKEFELTAVIKERMA